MGHRRSRRKMGGFACRDNMHRKFSWIILFSIACAGCTSFHHQIIPQEKSGPKGGELVYIDQRIPEYIEFVAIPLNNEAGEWKFQIYGYDKNLRPRSISRNCYIEIELPGGIRKGINLWSMKPFFWNKGIGHLENTIRLGAAKEFNVSATLKSHGTQDKLKFKYPSALKS